MAEYTMPGEKAFYEGCTTVPEMAKRAESLEGASFICLHLEGADPNGLNKSVEECVQLAGVLPQDDTVYTYDCEGKPSSQVPDTAPVKKALAAIMQELKL